VTVQVDVPVQATQVARLHVREHGLEVYSAQCELGRRVDGWRACLEPYDALHVAAADTEVEGVDPEDRVPEQEARLQRLDRPLIRFDVASLQLHIGIHRRKLACIEVLVRQKVRLLGAFIGGGAQQRLFAAQVDAGLACDVAVTDATLEFVQSQHAAFPLEPAFDAIRRRRGNGQAEQRVQVSQVFASQLAIEREMPGVQGHPERGAHARAGHLGRLRPGCIGKGEVLRLDDHDATEVHTELPGDLEPAAGRCRDPALDRPLEPVPVPRDQERGQQQGGCRERQ
jgi:hypothetical protein